MVVSAKNSHAALCKGALKNTDSIFVSIIVHISNNLNVMRALCMYYERRPLDFANTFRAHLVALKPRIEH